MQRAIYIGNPAKVSYQNELLEIHPRDGEKATIPVADIYHLEIDNAQVTLTAPAIAALAAASVAVAVSDSRHMPVAQLLPAQGHSLQGQHFAAQFANHESLAPELWRQIVNAKIHNQGLLVNQSGQDGSSIIAMAGHVKPHDKTNKEGRAAQVYFPLLFGKDFRRDPGGEGINVLLNYGYTVLRSSTSRALVSAGLYPGLGLFHSNRNNAFPLADDLMEPLRPLVDAAVLAIARSAEPGEALDIDRDTKGKLLAILHQTVLFKGKESNFQQALQQSASSLAKAFVEDDTTELKLPQLCDSTLTGLCGSW